MNSQQIATLLLVMLCCVYPWLMFGLGWWWSRHPRAIANTIASLRSRLAKRAIQ